MIIMIKLMKALLLQLCCKHRDQGGCSSPAAHFPLVKNTNGEHDTETTPQHSCGPPVLPIFELSIGKTLSALRAGEVGQVGPCRGNKRTILHHHSDNHLQCRLFYIHSCYS
jgi:hypothetical protein